MPIPRWEILTGQLVGLVVGLALIVIGLGWWMKDPGPTISTVTMLSATGPHHTHDKAVTTTVTGTTTSTTATPVQSTKPRRSEVVTVGLVFSGVLLIVGTSWLPRLRSLTVPRTPPKPEAAGDGDGGDAADDDE